MRASYDDVQTNAADADLESLQGRIDCINKIITESQALTT